MTEQIFKKEAENKCLRIMPCESCVDKIAKRLVERHPDLPWEEALRRAKKVVERAEKMRSYTFPWLEESSLERKKKRGDEV